jgi:hypothetical protein
MLYNNMKNLNASPLYQKMMTQDITKNTKFWEPVCRNNWALKFSVYGEYILLIVVSVYTGQTIIRYFDDEKNACFFINMIVNRNPHEVFESP